VLALVSRHRVVRFLVVGCCNFVVSFAAFYAAYRYLPLDAGRGAAANVFAYAAGMINSFLLNRFWTFAAEGHIGVHAARFAVLNAVTLAASTAIMFVLVDWAGYPELAVWLPLTIAIPVVHYFGMKNWTFARP